MWKEFKKFALRGNVIDLAVGVVIGGAFNKIVSSLVNDLISPIVGLFLGGIDLSKITIPIGTIISIKIGLFLQAVLDFLIISFSIFMVIKAITSFRKKQEKEEETSPIETPSKEEMLLEEIRDILKEKKL